MKEKIRYKGFKDLNEEEQEIIKNVLNQEYSKIEKLTSESSNLEAYIKTAKKETRKRFTVNLKLQTPKETFRIQTKDTEKGGDWDLKKAIRQALNALEHEVKHKLGKENKKRGGSLRALFSKLGLD